ncbi:MAG: class I SAM-dependent methyltransferase [Bacteroidia bacterium]
MALAQHSNLEERFRQQVENAKEYVLPFIEEAFPVKEGMMVLEIGAAEGGVLKPFVDRGCTVVGVDLSPARIETAKRFLEEEVEAGKAQFIAQNVYEEGFQQQWDGKFDLIVLKDTIEHIPGQERFVPYIKRFLKPDGAIFFGFPPWRMPFGGHQQVCKSKRLGKTPWFHLLPKGIYKAILTSAGESEPVIEELMEIKETGISLNRFERISRKSGLKIVHRRLFLVNPIYKYKFGWKPRVQYGLIAAIPWFRDWFTTCGWYVVKNKN